MKRIPKVVIKEAAYLKEFATKEELNKLDFNELDPAHVNKCVYGQMTGNCTSERAIALIEQCALRVYEQVDYPHQSTKLNGSPVGLRRTWANMAYYSPIEVWIDRNIPEFNKNLIAYLKGEKKTLRATYK